MDGVVTWLPRGWAGLEEHGDWAVLWRLAGPYRMVWEAFGVTQSSEGPVYGRADEWHKGPTEVDWELAGELKWDGCMDFQTNPECMVHGCVRADMESVGRVLVAVWDMGSRRIPRWIGS